jgi:hypothetical protein
VTVLNCAASNNGAAASAATASRRGSGAPFAAGASASLNRIDACWVIALWSINAQSVDPLSRAGH